MKVEATKFTEVGYVGSDVESMVRNLVDVSVKMEKDSQFENVRAEATKRANNRLVKLLVPGKKPKQNQQADFSNLMNMFSQMQKGDMPTAEQPKEEITDEIKNQRMSVSDQLAHGLLENSEVTIEMDDPQQSMAGSNPMMNQMGIDLGSTLGQMIPKKRIKRTVPVSEAREILIQEESETLVNDADINHAAIERAQNTGIIFIDEIDKITSTSKQNSGEVSREGFSVISCQSLKALKFRPSTVPSIRTTFCSLPPVPLPKVNPVI